MRRQDEADVVWVARCIVTQLRFSPKPLTRDQLTDRVLEHGVTSLGIDWKRTTASRRVRDAFKELRRQGYPVVSDGKGFKLATTTDERHRAAEKLRKMARNLFAEAERLEAAPVPREPIQTEMFEVAP